MFFVAFVLSCLLVSFQCPRAATTLINVTVDDQFGDPHTNSHISYTPTDAWSVAPACNQCPNSSSPSQSKAYNQTWHESFFSSNNNTGAVEPGTVRLASFKFFGNALYVACIIPPSPMSQMVFYIDGVEVGSYPSKSGAYAQETWQYNVIVYENTSMSMAEHQLLIQSGVNSGRDTLILLDSIMYTTTGSKSVPLKTIIGAVIGGVFFLLACGLLVLFYRRRRRRSQQSVPEADSMRFNLSSKLTWSMIFRRQSPTHALKPYETQGPHTATGHSNIASRVQLDHRILAWQQETHRATRSSDLAPPDMSEQLSSYYDNATTTESRRVRTPPPPPRQYIVRNK